jgi:hypothetical protein
MASSHVKESSNTTFFGTMFQVAKQFSDSVDILPPSVEWTSEILDKYDAVFVGVIPPTSPSANKLYGALNVISLLADSKKLFFVVDHPQVWQFKSSISSVSKNIDSIFTPFYRTKSEYRSAVLKKDKFEGAIKLLSSTNWPTTIYPELPWRNSELLHEFLPWVSPENLVGVNLDAHLLSEEPTIELSRTSSWSVEYPNTSWVQKISKLTTYPLEKAKASIRTTDEDVMSCISSSAGLVLPAQDRGVGTWWSYRILQALDSATPVITEWKESRTISDSWAVLIGEVEDMDLADRIALAMSQRRSYMDSIPSKQESTNLLEALVKTNKE